jgi:hypothetical protein
LFYFAVAYITELFYWSKEVLEMSELHRISIGPGNPGHSHAFARPGRSWNFEKSIKQSWKVCTRVVGSS